MRKHSTFPRPGDRIRLAIPLPKDESEPHARYGTVLERSCGRSNALRVRWDGEPRPGLAPDAGVENWLADASWYWDKAQLEVVDKHDPGVLEPEVAPLQAAAATEEDVWLSASPRANAGPGGGHVEGSLDAVAEWRAALASEAGAGPEASWEQLLANALGNGTPAAPSVSAPAPAAPAPVARPAVERTVEADPRPAAAAPAMTHPDIRKRTPASDGQPVAEPDPEPTPVAAPVQGWAGDDILPRSRSGGKRWGRR